MVKIKPEQWLLGNTKKPRSAKPGISIVGFGLGRLEQLTLETYHILFSAKVIIARSMPPALGKAFLARRIKIISLADLYPMVKSHAELYAFFADIVLQYQRRYGNVVYATPGNPGCWERTVIELEKMCRKAKIPLKIYPALSFLDYFMTQFVGFNYQSWLIFYSPPKKLDITRPCIVGALSRSDTGIQHQAPSRLDIWIKLWRKYLPPSHPLILFDVDTEKYVKSNVRRCHEFYRFLKQHPMASAYVPPVQSSLQ